MVAFGLRVSPVVDLVFSTRTTDCNVSSSRHFGIAAPRRSTARPSGWSASHPVHGRGSYLGGLGGVSYYCLFATSGCRVRVPKGKFSPKHLTEPRSFFTSTSPTERTRSRAMSRDRHIIVYRVKVNSCWFFRYLEPRLG